MYNHAPKDYVCPICLAIQGVENDQTMARQADIVYRDEYVLVYINSKFVGNNPGHVIVVPTAHFENLYELPLAYAHRIIEVSQMMALALKSVRQCDGIWIVQNNEPASGQHALHYHTHIFPRFKGDNLRELDVAGNIRVSDPTERVPYAEALRTYLEQTRPAKTPLQIMRELTPRQVYEATLEVKQNGSVSMEKVRQRLGASKGLIERFSIYQHPLRIAYDAAKAGEQLPNG